MRTRILRRAIILSILCPPMVALTKIKTIEEKPRMQQVGQRIVITGSPFYLDPNPNF